MLKNIKKEKLTVEELEEIIESAYKRYDGTIDKDNDYLELWNAFVTLIEFVQDNFNNNDELSPEEAIKLMKDLGFSNDDVKDLIKSGISND